MKNSVVATISEQAIHFALKKACDAGYDYE